MSSPPAIHRDTRLRRLTTRAARRTVLACAVANALAAVCPSASAQVTRYRVAQELPVGGTGGWDFVTVDTAAHRLFIARDDRVMVVDPGTGALTGSIKGLRGAQHVALAYGTGHGFITSGDDGMVVMFHLASLKVLKRIRAARDADVVVYDAGTARVFSFNGTAKSVTAIDARSGVPLKTLGLSGNPEFAMSDNAGHIYVNNASKAEVMELDTRALVVTRRWSLAPCKEPSGLALDVAHHLAFSTCSNRRMMISSTTTGTVVATVAIGDGPDGVVFDPATGDALSANGDGSVTIVHEETPTSFRVTQALRTIPGARTIALDATLHRSYTVTMRKRPTGKGAGMFTLLVIQQ